MKPTKLEGYPPTEDEYGGWNSSSHGK